MVLLTAEPALTTALSLLATIEIAQRTGAWKVDGACDPDGYVIALQRAVNEHDVGKAAHFTGILAAQCLDAIHRDDWRPLPGNVEFLVAHAVISACDPAGLVA